MTTSEPKKRDNEYSKYIEWTQEEEEEFMRMIKEQSEEQDKLTKEDNGNS